MNKKYILEIKFKNDPKIEKYKTDKNISIGSLVSVETQLGCFPGEIISIKASNEKETKDIPNIKGELSKEAVEKLEIEKIEKDRLFKVFTEQIKKHSLPMKPLDIEKCINGELLFLFSSENRIDFRDMVKDIQIHTRHYAKRQFTWFAKEKDMNWFKYPEDSEAITIKVAEFLDTWN